MLCALIVRNLMLALLVAEQPHLCCTHACACALVQEGDEAMPAASSSAASASASAGKAAGKGTKRKRGAAGLEAEDADEEADDDNSAAALLAAKSRPAGPVDESKELAKMMMKKRDARLYSKIQVPSCSGFYNRVQRACPVPQHAKQVKEDKNDVLRAKRMKLEADEKKAAKQSQKKGGKNAAPKDDSAEKDGDGDVELPPAKPAKAAAGKAKGAAAATNSKAAGVKPNAKDAKPTAASKSKAAPKAKSKAAAAGKAKASSKQQIFDEDDAADDEADDDGRDREQEEERRPEQAELFGVEFQVGHDRDGGEADDDLVGEVDHHEQEQQERDAPRSFRSRLCRHARLPRPSPASAGSIAAACDATR